MTQRVDRGEAAGAWALGCFVVGYNVMHHSGLFGTAGVGRGTRFADWVDLLTPFAVVVPLLAFLWSQQPRARWWVVAAVGALLYTEGHGIHLSANSIGNVAEPSDTIHLWDEVVGHSVWYLGLAVLITACTASASGRELRIPAMALVVGGALCGVTWATNGLEGGTAVASLVVAAAAVVPALRRDGGLAPALAPAGVTAAPILALYGIVHAGFPQPSSL